MDKSTIIQNFIVKANELHKDKKYSYPKINDEYKNAKTKITILCSNHNSPKEFIQTADRHLHSDGCQECSREKAGLSRRLTQEQFLNKAITIHGDEYDYSETKYEKWDIPIKIKCLIHGMFEQIPNAHLSGKGCSKCGINKSHAAQRKTHQEFIEEARSKHGNVFDYSDVVYVNYHTHIKIICKMYIIFQN